MDERENKLERLREAIQDVRGKGIAVRKAARVHDIPESTLRGRLNNPEGLDVKAGAQPIFSPKQEEELASYCIKMANIGYGFSRWQVIDLAVNMNKILQRDINPTKHWYYGFLSRHPEIAMVNPKKREKERDDAVMEETLKFYFSELTNLLAKYDLVNKPAHIWNVDESGISLDHNPPNVLTRKGITPHMVAAGHSPTTTVIAAVSALGETIPPYMIYKGKRLSKALTTGGLEGTEYRTSPSGWSNSILFLDFFKNHFLHHATTRPCILLYDGHSTHVTADIIQTAKEENVHLFVLPPHTSHCLQQLDVSVFGPFKKSLSTEFHKFYHEHPNSTITREQLPQLVGQAYVSALTVQNVMSGFEKIGIFPLDASAVDTSAPAITSQPTSQQKLGKVITPDPWKSGARNTTKGGGRKVGENKAVTAKKNRLNMDERENKLERLREAIQDVRGKGIAVRKAARVHDIPESTLRGRLNNPEGLDVKVGAQPIFSPKQEEELASYCIKMANIGHGFSRWQVIDLAVNMNKILQRDLNPTKHWYYGFLSRHPEIAMVNPKKREKVRDDAVTEETLKFYFSELTNLLAKYDLVNKPAHIWNVDESGISLDHNPPKVLTRKGITPHMVAAGHSPTTTVIAAVSALGETIPPYMIYKGKRLSKELKTGGLEGTEYRTSPSGWSNSILFLDFFKNHFLHHATTRPCILLYDGHSTHVTADIIQTAKEENVHLFVLPPHTSHCLQPLDVSVFGPFKKSLSTEFHKFYHEHPNSTITREQLPQLVGQAFVSALTVQNVMSGFEKIGIFPLDASAVDTSAPAITSQPTCQKKLGKVITPDPWKSGAQTTTKGGSRKVGENKAFTAKKNRFHPYSTGFDKCRICKSIVHQPGSHYCQGCAYKEGICAMCGK